MNELCSLASYLARRARGAGKMFLMFERRRDIKQRSFWKGQMKAYERCLHKVNDLIKKHNPGQEPVKNGGAQ